MIQKIMDVYSGGGDKLAFAGEQCGALVEVVKNVPVGHAHTIRAASGQGLFRSRD